MQMAIALLMDFTVQCCSSSHPKMNSLVLLLSLHGSCGMLWPTEDDKNDAAFLFSLGLALETFTLAIGQA